MPKSETGTSAIPGSRALDLAHGVYPEADLIDNTGFRQYDVGYPLVESLLYEHPLNERCRTLLRLEFLFSRFDFHARGAQPWDSRSAVTTLLDIASLLARADIKSDLIKELDRQRQSLAAMAHSPNINRQRLDDILDQLNKALDGMRGSTGQIGQGLRSNEFLTSIQQRSSIPGGTCQFDLPAFHLWLSRSEDTRRRDLDDWHRDLAPLHEALKLLLNLVRSSHVPTDARARQGFYQHQLPPQSAVQLVRVELLEPRELFAEISGIKHRFSIRFLEPDDWEHPTQTESDVDFRLTLCKL